jgi:hypothetical protein
LFGIIRPCRHRLSPRLAESWLAHLCGMCLALRDDHGQLARAVTNYDGLLISVLAEAQSVHGDSRRTAGPCPLRGLRTATIAVGNAPQLAAAVSLVLASAKVSDHIEDGDGPFGRRPVAGVARKVATRWARQGTLTGERVGFDTAVLLDAVHRQGEVEVSVRAGNSVLLATEPTETATAAAFAHTAVLAGRPGNAESLREAGRLFGRVAHLLDAVEDLDADEQRGAWNPLHATGTTIAEAHRLCTDAVTGIKLALKDVEFTDSALVHRLLVHELSHSVAHAFGVPHGPDDRQPPPPGWQRPGSPPPPGWQPPPPPGWEPPDQGDKKKRRRSGPPQWGRSRGTLAGCGMATLLCCSCQYCCAEHTDPWTGEPKQPWCNNCDCSCDDGCDCCDCCSCCDCDCCSCDC